MSITHTVEIEVANIYFQDSDQMYLARSMLGNKLVTLEQIRLNAGISRLILSRSDHTLAYREYEWRNIKRVSTQRHRKQNLILTHNVTNCAQMYENRVMVWRITVLVYFLVIDGQSPQ